MSQLNNYYEYLKGAGADVAPNVESFKKTLDDLGVARQYFGYLKDNNFDTPETFESFTKTLGLGKKKDGTTNSFTTSLSPSPSTSQSVSGDPIFELLKKRKKLKTDFEAAKAETAFAAVDGYLPKYDLASVQAQLEQTEASIKNAGFDPDELDKDLGSFTIPLRDDQISNLYKTKKSDPLQFNRSLSALNWEDASLNAIRKNSSLTPEQRAEKVQLIKENKDKGANLKGWDDAWNYANNTLGLIYDVTAGDADERERAIDNYKKDLIPSLANIFYKNKAGEYAGKNIPYEFGLMVNSIFDKYKTDQIAKANQLDFTDPNAIAGRQRSNMEVEQDGITYLQQGLSDAVANNPKLKEASQFLQETTPVLKDLKTKIDDIRSSDPELVTRYEDAIKSFESENAKLNEIIATPEYTEFKKVQDEVKDLEKKYKSASPDRKNHFATLYNNAVNRYTDLLDILNQNGYSEQFEKVKSLGATVEELDKTINTPELKQYITQYNELAGKVKQYDPQAKQLENISAWSNYLEERQKTMLSRYPQVAMNKAIEAAQDVTGPNLNRVERASVNLGYNVQKAIDMADILFGRLFRTPEQQMEKDMSLVGKDDLLTSAYRYNPNGEDLIAKPFVYGQTKEVRDKVDAIMNDQSLTEDEKKDRVRGIMYMGMRNGSVYQATNPRFGKGYNLSLATTLNTIVDVAPDILVSVGAALATGGGGSASLVRSLGPLFATTYVQGFSSYYTDAIRQGIANPLQYANMHTLIDAGTEILGTRDINSLRKFFASKKGFAAEFFRNVSEKQFAELVSNSKRTFGRFAVNAGLNTLQEPGEEVLAQLGGNILDKKMFGQKVGITEGAADTFVTMYVGQLPFTLLGLPGQYRQANVGSKMMYYNIGMNKDKSLAALENDFKAGNITQIEYDERRKVVESLAKAVEETPMNYADGNPMKDEDKIEYAFNRYVINRGSEESKTIPTEAQKEIQTIVTDAENSNNKLFKNATSQSQVQGTGTESNISQPQGAVQGQQEVGQGTGIQGQATQPQTNVSDSNIGSQGQVAPGKRLFNDPNPEAAVIETEFKKSKGIDTPEPAPITKLDEERSKKIADAYDQLVDSPDDPEVQAAYQAMADETMEQFDAIAKSGVKVEIWTGKGEPYKNSAEMIADVRDNKHMYIFSTEEGFGDTPITDQQRQQNALLRDSGMKDVNGKPLLVNDVFRFVHDYFGHTRLGNSFGAIGEENAWNVHARMYSPLARRAMTTETRGQNSWVNFNKSYRNPDGTMKKKGDEGYVPPAQRPFADQKMALLPEEFSNIEDSYSLQRVDQAKVAESVDQIKQSTGETGVTMNLDGSVYTGGGLVVPAASMNTTVEDLTPEMVDQFVEENRGKIEGNQFKIGLYRFPGSNRVSIDLNIITPKENRDTAVKFAGMAGQESIYDLDTNENIKTGATGDNPTQFDDKQFKEIANALANNRMPDVFGKGSNKVTQALSDALDKATKALRSANIKFRIVDSTTDTKEARAARGNQGLFVSEDGTIIIDRSKLADDIEAGIVVWHEASHPVMNIIRNTNKPLYDAVVRGLQKAAKTNDGVAKALFWAKSQPEYDNVDTQNDEAVVETIARINSGLIDVSKLDTGLRQKLVDFVNAIAKYFGIDPILSDTDLAAFKKTVSQVADALKTGRDIGEIVGQENVGKFQVDTKSAFTNKGVQARFSTEFFEDSNSFNKLVEDGYVVHNSNLSNFDGDTVVIHNPDSFATGKIKFRDKDLVEGEGGIYFTLKFGDVWASSKEGTAKQMANLINESFKRSGKARVVLVKGDSNKNLTSVKGAKALMGVLEILSDDGLIPLSAFRKALNAAGKKYGVNFDGRADAKSIHKDIQSKFMNVSNSSFERRGDFVRDVIDEIAKQDVLSKDDISKIADSIGAKRKMTTFSKASIIDSVAYATTERILLDVPNSHAYAVIEADSPVEIKRDGRHESYPWHIVTKNGSRPKLYLLKERPFFNDVFVAAKDTEKVKSGERFGDVSRAGLAQRGMGLAKVEYGAQASVGNRKNIGSVEINRTDRDFNGLPISSVNGTVYHRTNSSVSDILENGFIVPNQGRAKYGYGVYFNLEPKQTSFGSNQMAADLSGLNLIDLTGIDELFQVDEFNKAVSGDGGGINYNEVTNNIKQAGIDGVISGSEVVVFDSNNLNNIREASSQASVGNRDIITETGKKPRTLSKDIKVYHYSNNSDLSKDNVDPFRVGKSQFKKRMSGMEEADLPSGFYTTLSPNSFYGKIKRKEGVPVVGEQKKLFVIDLKDVNYYDITQEYQVSDRIPQRRLKELKDQGYDVLVGKGMVGEPELIVINKDKIVDIKRATESDKKNLLNEFGEDRQKYTDEDIKVIKSQISDQNAQASVGNRNLAPNGKPSNLTPKQYEQVRTPQFKNWFGDWENDPANASKVVDENGEPLVVYHNSPSKDVQDFKGYVTYFTDNKEYAGSVKGAASPNQYEVYLNIRNPYNAPSPLADVPKEVHDTDQFTNPRFIKSGSSNYDAVIGKDAGQKDGITYAVFNPNQIKSATANTGEFSTTDNRIQASVGNRNFLRTGPQAMSNNITVGGEDMSFILDYITPKNVLDTIQNIDPSNMFFSFERDVRRPIINQIKNSLEFWSKEAKSSPLNKSGDVSNVRLKGIDKAQDRVYALTTALDIWENNAFSLADISINGVRQDAKYNKDQASVGNRSEDDLRAEGTGKQRNRALASRYGDLDPKTQSKIKNDAFEYFQKPNKQTEQAVNEFIDGRSMIDMADYVLSNPAIPESSKVWMAAEVAKRLGTEIAAANRANNQPLVDALTDKQSAIYNEFAKYATSLGQAVQAFVAFKKDPNAVEFFLPKILKELEDRGVDNVTEDQKQEILKMLKAVSEASEGLPKDKAIIKLSHYLAGLAPVNPMDVLQSLWYAKILSGITTQSVNFFANLFNTVLELPAVGIRIAMLNKSPLALAAGVKGFGSGVAKGLVKGVDIVRTGVRSQEIDKYFSENPLEVFTWSRWFGTAGKVMDYTPLLSVSGWKYIGRTLAATDAFFATANQEAIANMLAYAEAAGTPAGNNFKKANQLLGNSKISVLRAKAKAKSEGFDPKSNQGRRRVIEIVAQSRKGTEEADAIGKRITLNYDPEGWTKPMFDMVVAMQRAFPPIKTVIPFARIVANLTENSLNYSPFGLIKAATGLKNPTNALLNLLGGKKAAVDKLTTEERVDMFNKFAFATTVLVALVGKVGDDEDDWFEITAGGSPDMQKRYELQKGEWRPYTITLKDGTKISYKDWPIAGALAGIGHIRDAEKYGNNDSTELALYASGFFLNFYEKSLLKGLQDFIGVANPSWARGSYAPDDTGTDRFKKYAAQQVRSIAVSNLTQQAGKMYSEMVTGDPQRDAKTFMEVIYRDLPMFNDGIRPIIDVFGEEVKYTTSERLTPVSNPEGDKIIKWLNENKFFVGVPKKSNIINADDTERPMNDEEYYEFRKIYGKYVKESILELMDDIKDSDKEIAKRAFEDAKKYAREQAYYDILDKYGFK